MRYKLEEREDLSSILEEVSVYSNINTKEKLIEIIKIKQYFIDLKKRIKSQNQWLFFFIKPRYLQYYMHMVNT